MGDRDGARCAMASGERRVAEGEKEEGFNDTAVSSTSSIPRDPGTAFVKLSSSGASFHLFILTIPSASLTFPP